MKDTYPIAIKEVLKHEGGFVDHPKDPGGATNKGVTQGTYDDYRMDKGLRRQSVRNITEDELADIYKTRYWNAVKGDDLPAGLDYAVFDFGVNSGPRRAAEYLQRALVVSADGKIGPQTLAAARGKPVAETIDALCDLRMRFLRGLGTFSTFGKGWTRRVSDVRAKAKELV